jgi:hypothetical protein
MYGMVNKAIADLVCSGFGEDKWEEIKAKAAIDIDFFISNESYPDEITYKLVGSASEVLGLPPAKILEVFGEHWVLKTATDGYGDLMDAGGATLPEFLENLPNFHTRIVMMMPRLQPPRFEVSDRTNNSLRLHYHTHRPGLSPFVVGLLRGLATRFDTVIEIKHAAVKDAGAEHDEFVITW